MASAEMRQRIDLLQQLARAYPDKHLGAETLEIYLQELDDIPVWLLRRAVSEQIRESPWFPKISELRQRSAKLAGPSLRLAGGDFSQLDALTADPLVERLLELEEAYTRAGELDPDEWQRLASEFEAADRPHRAASTLERLHRRSCGAAGDGWRTRVYSVEAPEEEAGLPGD